MHELPDILEQEKFENMVRDALTNLFDQAALQIHPLAAYLERSAPARSRGEGLRKTLEAAIERLRPADDPPRPGALEWRPYLILRWRYMDGARLQDIQERLALSERQLRREHSRALQAVAALLWDQLTPTHSTQPAARAISEGGRNHSGQCVPRFLHLARHPRPDPERGWNAPKPPSE